MRLTELQPIFVEYVPEVLEAGKLYISNEFETTVHLCACGWCNVKTVLPFGRWNEIEGGVAWTLTQENGEVTLEPSIGCYQHPCKSHYYIRKNKIDWCD